MKPFIPTFPNIETAAQWAADNQPFKAALNNFDELEYLANFGLRDTAAIVQTRTAMSRGDVRGAEIGMLAMTYPVWTRLFYRDQQQEFRRAA